MTNDEIVAFTWSSYAFLCIKRRTWALSDFTIAAGWPVLVRHINILRFQFRKTQGKGLRKDRPIFLSTGWDHSSKVRSISLVLFSLSSLLNQDGSVLFNVRWIVLIKEQQHSEYVCSPKREHTAKLCQ